jgi:hypothetical protein
MTHFENHKLTSDERSILREFSRRPWTAKFHKTLLNDTAPDGKVDMYILLDDDSGEQVVSIAVPHGEAALASWIAACCARPWFVEHAHDGKVLGEMAIAFNRALKPFMDQNGDLDGRDVAIAAMSILSAYVGDLPKYARDEISNRLLVGLNEMMRMGSGQ